MFFPKFITGEPVCNRTVSKEQAEDGDSEIHKSESSEDGACWGTPRGVAVDRVYKP